MTSNQNNDLIDRRITSIDALRGFDMLWISGGGYFFGSFAKVWDNPLTNTVATQLRHVEWEGFRFEDLIMPLFLFIVGVVMPFSVAGRVEKGHSRVKLHLHIVKRAAVLFLLGLIMNGLLNFEFDQLRLMGVLQRIAICYLFTALLVANTKWPAQLTVCTALLLVYWALMAIVPVPGFGPGVMTPEGNFAGYIDRLYLPGIITPEWYGPGDSNGLLSTLPAISTMLIGVLAGHWLRTQTSGPRKAAFLAVAGVLILITGYGWGMVFPVIKNIWTSSFALVAGGYSLLLLALFYWIIDVRGYKKWAFFFIVIGMNPLTIYFTQRFIDFTGISNFFVAGLARQCGSLEPVIVTFAGLMARWLFLLFLYRKRVFLKV